MSIIHSGISITTCTESKIVYHTSGLNTASTILTVTKLNMCHTCLLHCKISSTLLTHSSLLTGRCTNVFFTLFHGTNDQWKRGGVTPAHLRPCLSLRGTGHTLSKFPFHNILPLVYKLTQKQCSVFCPISVALRCGSYFLLVEAHLAGVAVLVLLFTFIVSWDGESLATLFQFPENKYSIKISHCGFCTFIM